MIWGETIDDKDQPSGTRPDAKRAIARLQLYRRARDARPRTSEVMFALRDASADTPDSFSVRCGAPIAPATQQPTPGPPGLTLATDSSAAEPRRT